MPLWQFSQLEMLNKDALRTRVLNLRDMVGSERLPNPPRHEEGMRQWILDAQCAITGFSLEDFGSRRMNAQGMPMSRAMSEVSGPDESQMSGSQAAFRDAKRASEVARSRNRGTQNLLSWDGM